MRELKTSHVEGGYCNARIDDTFEAFAAHDAACESNPLAARVRGLESKLARLSPSAELLATNAALAKRVAELELDAKVYVAMKDDWKDLRLQQQITIQSLSKEVKDLQSQLAWTPVAQGLPTEPGRYQFADGLDAFPDYWFRPDASPSPEHHWYLHNRRWFGNPLEWCQYTHWRKVALPVRRITLPEAT